jgi:DNA primase
MASIPTHVREQIRSASDIVEVIGGYMPLRRAGASFVALCPFHKEKTPSFHVSPTRQSYHCFGCHKGGDVFRFIQEYENVTYVEAAKRLAQRAGIRLEFEETPGQRQERALIDKLRDLHEQITQRWQQVLESDAAGATAREYLSSRGVCAEARKLFRLGCAPDAWEDTVNWARGRGWDLPLMERAGLIIARDAADPSRGYYDRFRGRLIFPIADEQGRVIGFSARILGPDEKAAKYVNSPESPIFTKSRVLYGLDKSKRPILDAGSAIVCEGQLDLIACFMAGVTNVVAPQGTALTSEHLRILRRYAAEVILCFDSDLAGQKAAARVLDDLLASGMAIRVINVPAPHDPDSFVRECGPEAFRELASRARDFFEFYLDFLCAREPAKTDRGRLAILAEMAKALGKTGNALLLDRYAQRTAMALAAAGGVAVSPDAVRAEFRKHLAGGTRMRSRQPESGQANPPAVAGPSPAEKWLLKLMLLNDEYCGWVALHLDPQWLQHAGVRALIDLRLRLHHDGTWQNPASFLGDLEDDALRGLASEVMASTRPIPKLEQQFNDVLARLRNDWIDSEIGTLSAASSRPELPDAERNEILSRLVKLRQAKREPLQARLTSHHDTGGSAGEEAL